MPSSLKNYAEFRAELDRAILKTTDVVGQYPDDPAIAAILGQMRQLKVWTENDQAPTQAQKDTLNFGALASRNLDDIDDDLVQSICEVASYVIYWTEFPGKVPDGVNS
jgi:Tsi6